MLTAIRAMHLQILFLGREISFEWVGLRKMQNGKWVAKNIGLLLLTAGQCT